MKFTEAKLEQAFIELLENEGFPHFVGNTISRADDEVLIEEDLQEYLLNRYKTEQLTEIEAQSIILQLKTLSSADLYESNKKIMHWLSDGFILKREDRQQKDIQIDDSAEGYVNFEYDENGYCIAKEGMLSSGHKYRNTW